MSRSGIRGACGRWVRSALLLGAVGILPASSCEDNVGTNSTGSRTFRASVGVNNEQAAGVSNAFSVVQDGSLVAFDSTSTNISTDPSAFKEIFVKHRDTGMVENVTKLSTLFSQSSMADCENPFISASGSHVAFESRGSLNGSFPAPQATKSIWVAYRNVSFGMSNAVFAGPPGWPDEDCVNPSIGPDGAKLLVVYTSSATNLVGTFIGSPVIGTSYIYAFDLNNLFPTTLLISHAPAGNTTYPASGSSRDAVISADGEYIVFTSKADLTTNLGVPEQVYRYATATGTITLVSAVAGTTNTPADGDCLKPCVSADGRFVAFTTLAANLGSAGGSNGLVVVRDMNPATSVITPAGDLSVFLSFGGGKIGFRLGLSDDGRFVAYGRRSIASIAETQVNVVDLQGGSRGVSLNGSGVAGNSFSLSPMLSGDGNWVFWSSNASDLVLGDTNSAYDIFGHGPLR